ncbi:DMT family transporter [Tropicimonas marinistellae]|uniref:DMT family transporter n=1 Tax=Tropicimonas marinistellae TaxID=1739787 RepID=UPI00082DDAFA|nr:multidrug efflux SMR transporter [Tropicimonas marinistellae]
MHFLVHPYIALTLAILFEVTGTAFLQRSEQFTEVLPTGLMVVFYGASFYFLTLALKAIPLGIAYAMWAGLGIVLVALLGFVVFGQKLDLAGVAGVGLIVTGVVVLNTLSDTAAH